MTLEEITARRRELQTRLSLAEDDPHQVAAIVRELVELDQQLEALTPVVIGLVGLFFIAFDDDGRWTWTGDIRRKVNDDAYLVSTYDVITGTNHTLRVVSLRNMERWKFFDDKDSFWHAVANENKRPMT